MKNSISPIIIFFISIWIPQIAFSQSNTKKENNTTIANNSNSVSPSTKQNNLVDIVSDEDVSKIKLDLNGKSPKKQEVGAISKNQKIEKNDNIKIIYTPSNSPQ